MDALSQLPHYPSHASRQQPWGAWRNGGDSAGRAWTPARGELVSTDVDCRNGIVCGPAKKRSVSAHSWICYLCVQKKHRGTCSHTKDTNPKQNVRNCSFVYLCICFRANKITASSRCVGETHTSHAIGTPYRRSRRSKSWSPISL